MIGEICDEISRLIILRIKADMIQVLLLCKKSGFPIHNMEVTLAKLTTLLLQNTSGLVRVGLINPCRISIQSSDAQRNLGYPKLT